MSLTQFRVDDGSHTMDGLRLLAQDGNERVEAFMGRKVRKLKCICGISEPTSFEGSASVPVEPSQG